MLGEILPYVREFEYIGVCVFGWENKPKVCPLPQKSHNVWFCPTWLSITTMGTIVQCLMSPKYKRWMDTFSSIFRHIVAFLLQHLSTVLPATSCLGSQTRPWRRQDWQHNFRWRQCQFCNSPSDGSAHCCVILLQCLDGNFVYFLPARASQGLDKAGQGSSDVGTGGRGAFPRFNYFNLSSWSAVIDSLLWSISWRNRSEEWRKSLMSLVFKKSGKR